MEGSQKRNVDLSLIICTWNNASRLTDTLGAISECRLPVGLKWELVLVNHNCEDDTDVVASEYSSKLPLVYVNEMRSALSQARNTGVNAASGRLILFTDDDVRPCKDWIAIYWGAYREKREGFFFGGPIESDFEVEKPDSDLLALAPPSVKGLNWGCEAKVLNRKQYFVGANWACPLEALKAVGGFDIRIGPDQASNDVHVGEESNLMKRLRNIGLSPWYLPEAKVVHFVPKEKTTLKHIAGREEAYGFNLGRIAFERNNQSPKIYSVPRWMWKEVLMRYCRWVWARLRGRNAYKEYVLFRRIIGMIRSVRKGP